MNKTRAALTHLWPTILLLLAIGCLIVFAWYPPPFLEFGDTAKFPLILILVAALIGPAMTALVYKKGKRSLLLDLTVVIIIQVVAVAWGTVALYQNRPYFMVFTIDRFEVFSSRKIEFHTIKDDRFIDKPLSGPIVLYANKPRDKQAYSKLVKEVMLEGKPDLQYRPEFWSIYSDRQMEVLNVSKPLNELRIMRPASVSAIDNLVQKNGGNIDELSFVPGLHQNGEFAAILDAKSGEIVAGLMVDPWID